MLARAVICLLLLPGIVACSGSNSGPRDGAPQPANHRILSYELLTGSSTLQAAPQLHEYTRPDSAVDANNSFSGTLHLSRGDAAFPAAIRLDALSLANSSMATLPSVAIELLQQGDRIVPVEPGPIDSGHPWWEFVLRPGYVWDEHTDQGYSRAAIPFALKERNADCIHNGLMSFLFNDAGQVSRVAFQISHQTCAYLQFAMHGLIDASYSMHSVGGPDAVTAIADLSRTGIPAQRPIEDLAIAYPAATPGEFGSAEEIDADDMTLYGFIIDRVHYTSRCDTPFGEYPYCNELALPSYSTAKSLVAGLGLMLAEAQYPGISQTSIAAVVPQCGASWEDVTIEHALDLVTGHHRSDDPHGDENAAHTSAFFLAEDHASKIDYACNAYPRQSPPGSHWSYHTWDTYLAGTALNAALRAKTEPDFDFYTDLLAAKLWQPLGLSRLTSRTRRSYDAAAQPFSGFGLTLLRDDIAALAVFLGTDDGRLDGHEVLDRRLFDAIKQRRTEDPGWQAESALIRYNNGFRTFDASRFLGCDKPTWLTTLSGYGGINIVLMPNDTAYYYFSDGGVHRYLRAVQESHRIRPMCPS